MMNGLDCYSPSPFRNGLGASTNGAPVPIPGGAVELWIPGLVVAGLALVLIAILKEPERPKRKRPSRLKKAAQALVL